MTRSVEHRSVPFVPYLGGLMGLSESQHSRVSFIRTDGCQGTVCRKHFGCHGPSALLLRLQRRHSIAAPLSVEKCGRRFFGSQSTICVRVCVAMSLGRDGDEGGIALMLMKSGACTNCDSGHIAVTNFITGFIFPN
jgi:hypothetical protein